MPQQKLFKPLLRHICVGIPLAMSLSSTTALATMGNLATTYGLLPTDIATAQALSMFNTQASAVYYNPAYLAKDSRGELTSGLMHADHSLKAKSLGGEAPLNRKNDTILNKPSQHVLLGMKTNLSSMSKMEHPLYFGVMLGVEEYGAEMMAFSSETSGQGQYLEYGRQPLFMNFGFGTKVWRGIDVGLSLRTTLHAKAELNASSELDGSTHHESMNVSATPSMKPIAGINIDWGETFCSSNDCWFSGLETAFSYRAKSNTHAVVDSNIIIEGMLPDPGMKLNILTLDSYQPDIISAGVSYSGERWQVAAVAEHQRWSDLEKELKKDTISSPALEASGDREAVKFKDIVIPRLGGRYNLTEHFAVSGGVAYSKSPIDSRSSLDMNFLDGDKLIVGLGLTAEYPKTRFLAFPVRFDVGYQYQNVDKKEFDLYHTGYQGGAVSYETVEAHGDVHVFSGSMTLKF